MVSAGLAQKTVAGDAVFPRRKDIITINRINE
jgi:hypothetical protein